MAISYYNESLWLSIKKEIIMAMKDHQILLNIMSKSLIILITSNYNED